MSQRLTEDALALVQAAGDGDLDEVKQIAARGGSIPEHALTVAASRDRVEVVRWLLSQGMPITEELTKTTVDYGAIECFKLFLDSPSLEKRHVASTFEKIAAKDRASFAAAAIIKSMKQGWTHSLIISLARAAVLASAFRVLDELVQTSSMSMRQLLTLKESDAAPYFIVSPAVYMWALAGELLTEGDLSYLLTQAAVKRRESHIRLLRYVGGQWEANALQEIIKATRIPYVRDVVVLAVRHGCPRTSAADEAFAAVTSGQTIADLISPHQSGEYP